MVIRPIGGRMPVLRAGARSLARAVGDAVALLAGAGLDPGGPAQRGRHAGAPADVPSGARPQEGRAGAPAATGRPLEGPPLSVDVPPASFRIVP